MKYSEKIAMHYYAFGETPMRCTVRNETIICTESIDTQTKKFVIDNTLAPKIINSLEAERISEAEFHTLCLKAGVKPA